MKYLAPSELIIAFLLFLTVLTVVFGSRYSRLYGEDSIRVQRDIELLVDERIGLEELHQMLDSLDVVVDREELLWSGRILGWRSLRAGRYEIRESVSYSGLLSNMARGIQDPGRVIVHSGIDRGILAGRLSSQLQADSLAFAQIFSDSSDLALELGLSGEMLFARMLPNTYEMYWTSSPESVVRRIHREFQQRIANRYATDINASSFSLDEIITLASIIEWEARHVEEKPKISGLYINRLNRNMLLQADPTVLYALGEKRRLIFDDYQYDHPYNTYRNAGLPPGPITNPDEQSIRAVLNPEDHEFLFMVATPDGNHVFNETFEEHRKSSEKWRRWIREQHRIKRELEREEANL